VPRVIPRFKDADVVRCWMSFAWDDEDGIGHAVRRGVTLRGSHPAVRRCPGYFVLNSLPESEEPGEYPAPAEEPGPRFTRPTRVKLKVPLLHGPARYQRGQVVELPASTASWVVDEGHGEEA
jgi:hypothetical protein